MARAKVATGNGVPVIVSKLLISLLHVLILLARDALQSQPFVSRLLSYLAYGQLAKQGSVACLNIVTKPKARMPSHLSTARRSTTI